MALPAIVLFLRLECFRAIMALAAELAGVNIIHLHDSRTFFHLEDFGMAGIAFKPFVSMNFTVERYLAFGCVPAKRLIRRYRQSVSSHHKYTQYNR